MSTIEPLGRFVKGDLPKQAVFNSQNLYFILSLQIRLFMTAGKFIFFECLPKETYRSQFESQKHGFRFDLLNPHGMRFFSFLLCQEFYRKLTNSQSNNAKNHIKFIRALSSCDHTFLDQNKVWNSVGRNLKFKSRAFIDWYVDVLEILIKKLHSPCLLFIYLNICQLSLVIHLFTLTARIFICMVQSLSTTGNCYF